MGGGGGGRDAGNASASLSHTNQGEQHRNIDTAPSSVFVTGNMQETTRMKTQTRTIKRGR